MNCANHPDSAAVAYCRTCGKPLCTNCARDVRGIIYCEHCLAERVEGTPAPGVVPGPVTAIGVNAGPNPALAGILGAIPFGVGAVYNGQYAKGLAHLVIFCLLVFGAIHSHDPVTAFFGLGIAFFVVYQIFDAVRTARAIQLGLPVPDPFGLGRSFGGGAKADSSSVPMAAIILIGLGVLLLLLTSLHFSFDELWPVLLIALGVWMAIRRLGILGPGYERSDVSMVWPALLVTVGSLSLMENLNGPDWGRTWPVLFLAVGLAKLFDHRMTQQLPPEPMGPGPGSSLTTELPPPAPSNDEVKNG